ncbi:MAG: DHHA1 domain-containing protein, partial [Sphingobacterium sp.]
GVNFLAATVDLPNADSVKMLAYAIKGEIDNLFLVLGADFDGKPSLIVAITDSLAKERGWNAGAIVKNLAKDIQGGGGGQPFFATAGGKNSKGLPQAIARAKEFLT